MATAPVEASELNAASRRGRRGRDEAELLADLRRGDRLAAEILVELTYPLIYRSLYRLCGDGDAASDLTQDTYARAWRALDQFDGRSRFSTWLYRIAYTTFLNHVRRPQRFVQLDDAAPVQAALTLEADPLLELDAQRLRRAVLALPEELLLRGDRALLGRGAGARDRAPGRPLERRHPQAAAPRDRPAPHRARRGAVMTRISRRRIERGLRLPAPAPRADLGRRIKDQIPDDLFGAPDDRSRRDLGSGTPLSTGAARPRALTRPAAWAVAASLMVAIGAGWLAVRLFETGDPLSPARVAAAPAEQKSASRAIEPAIEPTVNGAAGQAAQPSAPLEVAASERDVRAPSRRDRSNTKPNCSRKSQRLRQDSATRAAARRPGAGVSGRGAGAPGAAQRGRARRCRRGSPRLTTLAGRLARSDLRWRHWPGRAPGDRDGADRRRDGQPRAGDGRNRARSRPRTGDRASPAGESQQRSRRRRGARRRASRPRRGRSSRSTSSRSRRSSSETPSWARRGCATTARPRTCWSRDPEESGRRKSRRDGRSSPPTSQATGRRPRSRFASPLGPTRQRYRPRTFRRPRWRVSVPRSSGCAPPRKSTRPRRDAPSSSSTSHSR